jgi:3-oxoadipate enol-lactonase/4-carboxymuconolactone decarboxylase
VNRVELNHTVDGPADAPALVLSSSLGATLSIWGPLIPDFVQAFRVIRYDHRGHGGSPIPPGPYAMADLGADVVHLLDRLQIARASFCGTSLGGMVGMWLGVFAPERVDRLALLSTSPRLGPSQTWLERAATVRAHGTSAIAPAVVGRWFTAAFAAREPALVAQMIRMVEETPAEGYAATCEAIAAWDICERLPSISAPTLVVAAEDDAATPPSHAYAIGASVPHARVVVLEDAAHLAMVERPRAVARLVLDHLTGPKSGRRRVSERLADAESERAQRGESVRRAVLGDAHVDRARASATALSAPFQEFLNRSPWGDVWTRPGLSLAQRSIITLAVLSALRHEEELEMHVVAAVRNGLTPDQIREVLIHVSVYAGMPVANRAFAIAERALLRNVEGPV